MLEVLPNVICVGFIIVFLVFPAWLRMQWKEWRARKEREEAVQSGRNEPVTIQPWIDPGLCMGSGACVTACPEDVLKVIDGQALVVDGAACVGHGACEVVCPVDAIQLVFGSDKRGVDIPKVSGDFQTNVPGLFVAGELGGMGLIANAVEQGSQALDNAIQNLKSHPDRYDVLIVGAGPAGLSAGAAAVERRIRYAILEQEEFGGAIRHYPRQKLVFSRPMQFRGFGKIGAKTMRKEELVEAFGKVVDRTGLTIKSGVRVDAVERLPDGGFEVRTNLGVERAQRVILAVGRRGTPRRLNVPGEEQEKVAYWLQDAELYRNQHLLVVGGGDSAVEAAVSLGEQPGNRVWLSYRRDKITRPKKKNLQKLREAVRRGRVELVLNSDVTRIGIDRVFLKQEGEEIVLPNDFVFVFAGGVLPTKFLKNAGIMIETHYGRRIETEEVDKAAAPVDLEPVSANMSAEPTAVRVPTPQPAGRRSFEPGGRSSSSRTPAPVGRSSQPGHGSQPGHRSHPGAPGRSSQPHRSHPGAPGRGSKPGHGSQPGHRSHPGAAGRSSQPGHRSQPGYGSPEPGPTFNDKTVLRPPTPRPAPGRSAAPPRPRSATPAPARDFREETVLRPGLGSGDAQAPRFDEPTRIRPGLESSPGRSAPPAPGRSASPAPGRSASPAPGRSASPAPRRSASPAPGRSASPAPGRSASPAPGRSASPAPGRSASPAPGRSPVPRPSASSPPGRSSSPSRSAPPPPSRSASPAPPRSASPAPARRRSATPPPAWPAPEPQRGAPEPDTSSLSHLLLGPSSLVAGAAPASGGAGFREPENTILRPHEELKGYLAGIGSDELTSQLPPPEGTDFEGFSAGEGTEWVRAVDVAALEDAMPSQPSKVLDTAHRIRQYGRVVESLYGYMDAARQYAGKKSWRKLAIAVEQAEGALEDSRGSLPPEELARHRSELLLLRGEGAAGRESWDEALEALEESVVVGCSAADPQTLSRGLGALGRAWNRMGRHDLGEAILEEAWSRAVTPEAARATALRALAALQLGRGQLDEAERRLTEAWDVALSTGSAEAEGRARRLLADLRIVQGRLLEASELLTRADGLLKEGDLRIRAAVLSRSIEVRSAQGRYGAALQEGEELIDLARNKRLSNWLPEACAQLGTASLAVGFRDVADDAASLAVEALGQAGAGAWAWRARIDGARLLCELERFDQALVVLGRLEAVPESPLDDPPAQVAALRARALAARDPRQAAELASAILHRTRALDPIRGARARLDAAWALLAVEDLDTSRKAAKRGLEALQDVDALGARLELLIAMQSARPETRVLEAIARSARRVLVDLPRQHADSFRDRPVIRDALERH